MVADDLKLCSMPHIILKSVMLLMKNKWLSVTINTHSTQYKLYKLAGGYCMTLFCHKHTMHKIHMHERCSPHSIQTLWLLNWHTT